MKMNELIKKRKARQKARHEYHGFMSVHTIRDINTNYKLLEQALELENRLVKATNEETRMVNSFK
jgi:hypothetical protein